MILRLVSRRHGFPISIREMVMGEMLASLANSDLLMSTDSRNAFSLFFAMSKLIQCYDE